MQAISLIVAEELMELKTGESIVKKSLAHYLKKTKLDSEEKTAAFKKLNADAMEEVTLNAANSILDQGEEPKVLTEHAKFSELKEKLLAHFKIRQQVADDVIREYRLKR
jgi:hypothetical protein